METCLSHVCHVCLSCHVCPMSYICHVCLSCHVFHERRCCLGVRELGTRQTWDLTRLDSMAAEARALCDTIWRLDGGPGTSKGSGVGTDTGPSGSARTSLLSRARRVPWRSAPPQSRTASPQGAPASVGGVAGRGTPGVPAGSADGRPLSGDGVPGEAGRAVPLSPGQALEAVNRVMFERHGYRRMDRHGDPRCRTSSGKACGDYS